MATTSADAVVIGGGHHGLVAATVLADAGWDVCVLEATDHVGGAIRSAELAPGFTADLFSAFYPLAAASPVLRALDLAAHGLRWRHAPTVLAHPPRPGADRAAQLHRDRERTAAGLAAQEPADGAAWLRLCAEWDRVGEPVLRSLFGPFPPVRAPAGLLRRIGTASALRLARFLLLPARRMAEELFAGEAARLLLLGNAAHADVPPDAPGGGIVGWLLAMIGQQHGFPVPAGGSGALAAALAARATAAGARIRTGEPAVRVEVRGGRAVAVHTAGGSTVRARRAVVADVPAPTLYARLLPAAALPARLRADLDRFCWDTPVVKVNWALSGPIPWRAAGVAGAGTVHLGADGRGLVHWSADLETGTPPRAPFLLLGQMTTADPGRSPAGTESAWAYTHLPRGTSDAAAAAELAERVDGVLEEFAPGFGGLVRARTVQGPAELVAADPSLRHGTLGGGTSQLFQQALLRPLPGLGRPETVIGNLYLGSASAHPGPGVHGACGWNAARAALADHGRLGPLRRRVTSAALELLYRDP